MNAETLRNSILQLAISGKLVEQREEDGTAEDLYQQILKEKDQLVKEGKIKKTKPLPAIKPEEIPFEVPFSWKWVKLGNVASFAIGKTPTRSNPEYWGGIYNWVSISDFDDTGYITSTREKITEKALSTSFKGRLSPKGSLLMSFKLTIGKTNILNVEAVHNEAIITLNPIYDKYDSSKMYLFHFLPVFSKSGLSRSAIKGYTLNSQSINNILIPLPPISEQKRIVERIEELLPLVEEYGEANSRLESLNSKFPDEIKQSILQYAIQGKLLEQREEEGIAEDLYQQVLKEKEELVKEGKIKKTKALPVIQPEEIPFEVPLSWKWIKLGEISHIISGLSYKKEDISSKGVRVLRGGNVVDFDVKLFDDDIHVPSEYISHEILLNYGDIIIVSSTGSKKVIGKPALIKETKVKLVIGAFLRICRLVDKKYSHYLFLIFMSTYYRQHIRDLVKGTNINNIKNEYLTNLLIPFPPLSEQQRIVEKIEEFMQLVNELKGEVS
jgi:type I restriction enzyme, S subunit